MHTQTNGRTIRAQRRKFKWTQQDLAGRVGVAVTTISRWERGTSKPSKLAVAKLQQTLLDYRTP